ncbi:DUF3631 domain-containing protein [Angustibacter sp. McL0619]|uniref:DUF3631 domain-containing protein n=1 Tax=Angustibacter sp. McL0619 TaxID=3415676 RepID=UPI003CF8A3E9
MAAPDPVEVDQLVDVDGAALLDDIGRAVTRYVVLPSPEALVAVVLWIAATHAVPAWNCAARLVIRAVEKRCGKSRLLDLVEALCHRPLMTTNASPSAVYRSIGMSPKDPPTLLIDEADAIFGPKAGDNEDLRGLLNAGHQRGRPTLRYDAGTRSVDRIETFAMAALAGIGRMPDTIEDRAAVIKMKRRAPHEEVQPYRVRRDGPQLRDLKDRLNQWVRAHLDELTAAVPAMPVEDRAADTWEPLVAIADVAGGHWPARARTAVLALTTNAEEASEVSLSVRLLMDVRDILGPGVGMKSTDLVDRLKLDDEAPWSSLNGSGITVRVLAQMLGKYGVYSTRRTWEDGTVARGYLREEFLDTWMRYCPAPTDPADPAGPAGAAGPGDPSQVSQVANRRSAPDTYAPLATSSGKPASSVSGLTRPLPLVTLDDGPPSWTCHGCGQPLALDDGTHLHPTCTDPEDGR